MGARSSALLLRPSVGPAVEAMVASIYFLGMSGCALPTSYAGHVHTRRTLRANAGNGLSKYTNVNPILNKLHLFSFHTNFPFLFDAVASLLFASVAAVAVPSGSGLASGDMFVCIAGCWFGIRRTDRANNIYTRVWRFEANKQYPSLRRWRQQCASS